MFVLSLCSNLFRNSVRVTLFSGGVKFLTKHLDMGLPTWINSQFVTLILKEETIKVGTTSGMLITGLYVVKTNLEF